MNAVNEQVAGGLGRDCVNDILSESVVVVVEQVSV